MKQSSRTSNVVFPPAFLVAYVSRMMTLLPGDLILTGTPAGVGPLAAGDVVEVEIEGSACAQWRLAANPSSPDILPLVADGRARYSISSNFSGRPPKAPEDMRSRTSPGRTSRRR